MNTSRYTSILTISVPSSQNSKNISRDIPYEVISGDYTFNNNNGNVNTYINEANSNNRFKGSNEGKIKRKAKAAVKQLVKKQENLLKFY